MNANDFVMFPVPVDRLEEVAQFLYGSGWPVGTGNGDDAEAKHEALPMGQAELDAAIDSGHLASVQLLERIYKESEPKFRNIMVLVASRAEPGQPVPFAEISEAIGWTSPRSLAGALGAYGNRANHRYDGAWPMVRVALERDNRYFTMPAELAEEIRRLHELHDLPLVP